MGFFNKKGIAKNIGYYLSEIVVVVIGIFIAIQLNNWNEGRKEQKLEEKALYRIYNDLKTDEYLLDFYKKDLKKSSNFLKEVVYHNRQEALDSVYPYATKVFFHYKYNSEYINLKYSGKLNLITNDTLRGIIVKFYEAGYTYYDELADLHKQFVANNVEPYFSRTFPSDTTGLIKAEFIKPVLKSAEMRDILIDQIMYYKVIDTNVRTTEIKQVIEAIENEFKNRF